MFQNSIKNARDAFDGYHESGRIGWRDNGEPDRPPQPLNGEAQAIMNEWQGRSDDELWQAVCQYADFSTRGVAAAEVERRVRASADSGNG